MSDVTAIIIGPESRVSPPEGVAGTLIATSLDALPEVAARAATGLLWLLAASAVPSASTLARLLEHADRPVASLPVDAAGRPVEVAVGRFHDDDDQVLEGILHRTVPLRHTMVVSLVVERAAAAELEPPSVDRFGVHAGTEWTARLFARRTGVLVPDSRVEIPTPGLPSLAHTVRVARSGTWRRREAMAEIQRAWLRRPDHVW